MRAKLKKWVGWDTDVAMYNVIAINEIHVITVSPKRNQNPYYRVTLENPVVVPLDSTGMISYQALIIGL